VARGAAPVKWSDAEGIAWKIEVPGRGHSSPVVWGDKLYLTTAVEGEGGTVELRVMCVGRKTGAPVWVKTVKTVKPHEGYHHRYGSYASNTPVTDGKRVYTSFGSFGAYVFSMDGKLLWEWDPGIQMRMRNAFGEGTAVVLDGELLLLNYDHEGEDFLAALDAKSGKVKWKAARDEPSNWSPPLVLTHDGVRQAIVAAPNKVRSYDLRDGKVIWECAGLGLNTIPAPVTANGMVYVMSGFRNPNLLAIRLGGSGDITGTERVAWTTTKGTSYTASPVLHEGKLYFVTDSGMLSCVDAATGKVHYERVRLPKPYNLKSSLVAANGMLYVSTEDGDVLVVKMGETFDVVATNSLEGQSFIATPAIAGGEMYLRSRTHLFCVRGKAN
jgi:outer membrane protein assembly factor BamB